MIETNKECRDFIERYLLEHFVGPGYTKEIYACSDDLSDEIIDQPVSTLYSSAILKPQQGQDQLQERELEDDELDLDSAESNSETEDLDEDTQEDNESKGKHDWQEYVEPETNNPFESHCGLIACTSLEEKTVNVTIRYARYYLVSDEDRHSVQLKLGHLYPQMKRLIEYYSQRSEIQNKLQQNKGSARATFADYFIWDDEKMYLSLAPKKPHEISLKNLIATNDLVKLDDESNDARFLLNRLIRSSLRRRRQYEETLQWILGECNEQRIPIEGEKRGMLYLQEYKKTEYCRYLKVLLKNDGEQTDRKDSSDYMCQVEIEVAPHSGRLQSYRDPWVDRSDREQQQIEYLYREEEEYGKGIGCAVAWDRHGASIKTTFAPSVDIKKSANSLDSAYCKKLNEDCREYKREGHFDSDALSDYCNLLKLSHWTEYQDSDEYVDRLEAFVEAYALWHALQRARVERGQDQDIAKDILDKQGELLERLQDNVSYLRSNEEALKCFRYANTAMLIQMTIARDKNFAKNRDRSEVAVGQEVLNSLDYFKDHGEGYAYRPFQLAFLLMNVKSTMEQDDHYRTNGVDLIWFPTGGGKTEAYLALTALTIIYRRHCEEGGGKGKSGVTVIMRYTLRLLATQQFERASYLICALEFMRNKIASDELNLGKDKKSPISIGLWVGSGVTPNKYRDLQGGKYGDFLDNPRTKENPFPVSCCPWCGSNLIPEENVTGKGYLDHGELSCIHPSCVCNEHNGYRLPIKFVDEGIYKSRPTLLFATVDKFAGIHKKEALGLLGAKPEQEPEPLSPNLIIQDELHLISGPLGSMVGFFESLIDYLATRQEGRIPKIVASTATTRNTSSLIRQLYKREVHIFPASGITYKDNFFSHIEDEAQRRHLGLSAQVSSVKAEIRIFAHLLLARLALMKQYLVDTKVDLADNDAVIDGLLSSEGHLRGGFDDYWSLVAYYTSLKEVGRMRSRVAQEISLTMRSGKRYMSIPMAFDYLWMKITDRRIEEFTGRIESSKVKGLLSKVEQKALFSRDNNKLALAQGPDIILATNMISVGIDISRWNMMLMSSLPSSTAEYIQATSRIARSVEGLVVNLFNRRSSRSLSIYENYIGFHNAYYKYVEPLSITPATQALIRHKVLNNILQAVKNATQLDEQGAKEEVKKLLTARFDLNEAMQDFLERELNGRDFDEKALSLRDIEGNIGISIKQLM